MEENSKEPNILQEMTIVYQNDTQNSLLILGDNGKVQTESKFTINHSKLTSSGK